YSRRKTPDQVGANPVFARKPAGFPQSGRDEPGACAERSECIFPEIRRISMPRSGIIGTRRPVIDTLGAARADPFDSAALRSGQAAGLPLPRVAPGARDEIIAV